MVGAQFPSPGPLDLHPNIPSGKRDVTGVGGGWSRPRLITASSAGVARLSGPQKDEQEVHLLSDLGLKSALCPGL